MSNLITKRIQVGSSDSDAYNFVMHQSDTPDGSVHISNGSLGSHSPKMTLTHEGNVGIGTTTPGAELEVNGGSTTGTHSRIVTTGSGHNFDMVDASSTARIRNVSGRLHLTADQGNEYADSEIRLLVDNNIKMTVNADGHVTAPYQPAFCQQGTGTRNFSGTAARWTFVSSGGNVVNNNGNHYNASTGTFTCPVSGMYKFTWQMAVGQAATGPAAFLQKNGVDVGEICINYGDSYDTASGSYIVYCNENDTISVEIVNYNSTTFTLRLGRCIFSGFLIG